MEKSGLNDRHQMASFCVLVDTCQLLGVNLRCIQDQIEVDHKILHIS